MTDSKPPSIKAICDLRQYSKRVDNIGTMQALWLQVNEQLVGKTLTSGQMLTIPLAAGPLGLWIVDTANITQVEANTAFSIIDILRSPKLLYTCQVCGKYGPLRCTQCVHEKILGGKERLCTECAHFIKDKLSAYCPKHIPKCTCLSQCEEQATFSCGRCHKLYGEHVHLSHPHNPDIDYCRNCHQRLFGLCITCSQEGRVNPGLGKSQCGFRTREMENACDQRLCWEHSFQWKIWGPHNRGLTLCNYHKQQLGSTNPADLLFMMIMMPPPRYIRYPLSNTFRIRRIINRNRTSSSITFDQLGYALNTLSDKVGASGQARYRYEEMMKAFNDTMNWLPQKQNELLAQIKSFYQQAIGRDAAAQIVGMEIKDRFMKPGQPIRYRVQLYLNSTNKGLYIGRKGATVEGLRLQFNIDVDF